MNRDEINMALGMSEEEQDLLANAYESDNWEASNMGKVIKGRPRLAEEETRAITVRLPISQIAKIDQAASREGKSRSSTIRAVLDNWLKNAAAL